MPCTGGPSREQVEFESRAIRAVKNGDLVDKALLCSACKALEKMNYDFDENPLLSRWWDGHKKDDEHRLKQEEKERLQREAVKEIAKKPFNELTDNDKQLLKKHGYL